MDTPICDFVRHYAEGNPLRLHMPGHKGKAFLGTESLDITEITGADSLYEADGIIKKSEENASFLFGCATYYATEGSSQCIRAMLYLAMLHAQSQGKKPIVAAGRNAHKAFVSAAVLLDIEVAWLFAAQEKSYLSCNISPMELEHFLSRAEEKPTAVYITSPDYLGAMADVRGIAQVCKKYGVLLLVDNAHGAYLRFLPASLFPIDLGADLCCSSAHKTLPVLTGGAYLHLSKAMQECFFAQVRAAMVLFGSTSPSYLILQSLDAANPYMAEQRERLKAFIPKVEVLKQELVAAGYSLCGTEPMKITIAAKKRGYTGMALSELLARDNIICEFADKDYLVLMPTPEIKEDGLKKLKEAMECIPQKAVLHETPPVLPIPERVLPLRKAALSLWEMLPTEACEGRILATPTVACPPAVPILVCGERIDKNAMACFRYYGVEECAVVSEIDKENR